MDAASNESKQNLSEQTDSKSELSLRIVESAENTSSTVVQQPNEAENRIDLSQDEAPTELEMREEISSPTIENSLQIVDETTPIKNADNDREKAKASEEDDQQTIQTPEEMKKIIFTQSQLKRLLSGCPQDIFRAAVIGGYVRVNAPDLPQTYADSIFVDQIVDVLEPQSYQHLWLNRRIRLRHLGDYESGKVIGLKIQQQNELRPFFDYMEAKGEHLPTKGFIKQKENQINLAMQELALKEKKEAEKDEKPAKVQIKRGDLSKIALNPVALRNLAKLEFARFRDVLTGCFVCMPAIRKDRSKDCQYHIVRVKDCVHGQRKYKVRNVGIVDYQLVLPFYGNYIINWVKSFSIVTDDGFRQWIDDMKSWNEQIPTLDQISEKAAQLQLALNEAEKIPSSMDLERHRQEEEERAKRAKIPVGSAQEMEPCLLSRPELEKLSKLGNMELLTKTLTGCFVRLNAGGDGQMEIDQILGMELNEKRGGRTDRVLDLKYTGTISLTALIYIVSGQKLTEAEFKEFAKKIESEKDEKLPIHEFVHKKWREIREALGEDVKESPSYESGQLTNQSSGGSNEELLKPKIEIGSDGEQQQRMGVGQRQYPRVSLPTKDGELTVMEMRKVMLSVTKMADLMACNKETLAKIVRGMYIRIAAKRPERSSKEQYFVDEVRNVTWGGEPYKIRGNILTDIRLHCKKIGEKSLMQIYRTAGDGFNEQALMVFGEDMKKWKFELPSLAYIDKKSREYISTVSKLPKIPRGSRAGRPMDISFVGGQRGTISSNLGTPFSQSSSQTNPAFEQLQQFIQKQVVSSVLVTPGMAQNWPADSSPQIQPQFASPPQHQQYEQPPVNWQRQTDPFITGMGGTKRPLPDPNILDPETWRMQQQQKELRRQRQQQQASTSNPNPAMFRTSLGMLEQRGDNMESLMNVRDFSAIDPQQQPALAAYRQDRPNPYDVGIYDADQFFGTLGGTPQMQHYNYAPAQKRARQSPQPPPIEHFY